jgi:CubicO group peptidase (beta-lactamase class C family)
MTDTFFALRPGDSLFPCRDRLGSWYQLSEKGEVRESVEGEGGWLPATEAIPGCVAYSTAKDIGRFYEATLGYGPGHATNRFVAAARLMVEQLRPPLFDRVERSRRPYGLGLCVDLRQHALPALSARSYGHAAFMGSSTGLADPERGLAAVLVFNDALPRQLALERRRRVLDAVLEDIEEGLSAC